MPRSIAVILSIPAARARAVSAVDLSLWNAAMSHVAGFQEQHRRDRLDVAGEWPSRNVEQGIEVDEQDAGSYFDDVGKLSS